MRVNLGTITVDDESLKLYARYLGKRRATRDDVRRAIWAGGCGGFESIIDECRKKMERSRRRGDA